LFCFTGRRIELRFVLPKHQEQDKWKAGGPQGEAAEGMARA
jgi:hypothetical protein